MSEKIKYIAWVQHGGEYIWAHRIALFLRKQNIETCFVTFSDEAHSFYKEHGLFTLDIAHILETPALNDPAQVRSLEKKFGPPSFEVVSCSDVHLQALFKDNIDQKIDVVAKSHLFWEQLFKQYNFEAIVLRDRGSFATRAAHQVAQKQEHCKVLQLGVGPDDNHFAIYDQGTHFSWHSLIKALEDQTLLSPERKAEIDAFVEKRVPYKTKKAMILKLNTLNFKGKIHGKILHWINSFRLKRQPKIEQAIFHLKNDLQGRRQRWIKCYQESRYDPVGDKPYLYMPLFHLDETVHLINTRHWCENITSLIKLVSASLPLGYELYVKEHPVILGDLSLKQLDAIKALHNVRLLHPAEPSQVICKNSSAVLTTEGSIGWEGFLLKRPVIILSGYPFYAHNDIIHHVTDPKELEDVIFNCLSNENDIYEEKIETWYNYIDKLLITSFEGVIETYEYPHVTEIGERNIQNVAQAIIDSLPNTRV